MSFHDFLLDDKIRAVVEEARTMVRDEIDPAYLKAMDRDEVRFPGRFIKSMLPTICWDYAFQNSMAAGGLTGWQLSLSRQRSEYWELRVVAPSLCLI